MIRSGIFHCRSITNIYGTERKKAPRRPSDKLNRQAVRLEAIFLMVCFVMHVYYDIKMT